jgi:RHS repeat-associated protein
LQTNFQLKSERTDGWTYFGCVERWHDDGSTVYLYYDGWNLLQEGNNAWGPTRVYVHGSRVDEIVWSYNTFTGEQAYHHYDARGHCTLLTDSGGAIMEQYEYDAFGQPYFYDKFASSISYSIFGNRFLFTGREWLPDLHLYDYRNRLYQPELGRFLQPDPKEFGAGDYNLYRYCHNDPVNKSDPTGLDLILLWQVTTAGLQGHTATLSGNNKDGWHFFEKQGGEGQTSGNVHLQFKTLEQFRMSTRGDG